MAQERPNESNLKEKFRRGGIVVAGIGAVTLLFAPGIGALMLVGGGGAYFLAREKSPYRA